MTQEFNVVIERDADGYYVASVPALRGCHTQAKSLDALMKRIRQAIELCLEVEEPIANEFVGVTVSTVNRWENGKGTPSPLALQRIEELWREAKRQAKG